MLQRKCRALETQYYAHEAESARRTADLEAGSAADRAKLQARALRSTEPAACAVCISQAHCSAGACAVLWCWTTSVLRARPSSSTLATSSGTHRTAWPCRAPSLSCAQHYELLERELDEEILQQAGRSAALDGALSVVPNVPAVRRKLPGRSGARATMDALEMSCVSDHRAHPGGSACRRCGGG